MTETLQPETTWIAEQLIQWNTPTEQKNDPTVSAEVQQSLIQEGTLYVNRDGQVDHKPKHTDYPPLP